MNDEPPPGDPAPVCAVPVLPKQKPITAPPLPPQALRYPIPAGAPDSPKETGEMIPMNTPREKELALAECIQDHTALSRALREAEVSIHQTIIMARDCHLSVEWVVERLQENLKNMRAVLEKHT